MSFSHMVTYFLKLSRRVSLSAEMDSYITTCNHGKLHPTTFAFFYWLEASYRFTCTQGEVLHRDVNTRRQGSLEVTLEPVLHKYLCRKFKVLSNLLFQYPRINTTPPPTEVSLKSMGHIYSTSLWDPLLIILREGGGNAYSENGGLSPCGNSHLYDTC